MIKGLILGLIAGLVVFVLRPREKTGKKNGGNRQEEQDKDRTEPGGEG